MISILVLEDNDTLSVRISNILSKWDFVSRVLVCRTIADCKAALMESTFDVLLADINLPDGNGISIINEYRNRQPAGISIVISSMSDSDTIVSAISSGAIGYLYKDDSSFQIVEAIKMALRGESPISPPIAFTLCNRMAMTGNPPLPVQGSSARDILTERETEVLSAIAKGLTYAETAGILNMSKNTVPVHIRNIYRKLQARNRSEAVYEARAMGINL